VARAYAALVDELAAVRAAAPIAAVGRPNPVKGDPFRDFAHFATHALTLETVLSAVEGVSGADIQSASAVALTGAFPGLRASPDDCARVLELLADGPKAVRDLLLSFPVEKRRGVELGLAWMAKYGFIDWLAWP
jgi:D-inositol-3-phosphate glycosyltransferase